MGDAPFLFIDALNETPEPGMWATELADMRRRLTATGWVGFAVSCRSSYLDVVEPLGGPDDGFVHVEHRGYQGREFEAIDRIFELHNVGQPRVPLLVPEFANPLFLKLYCEGLEDDPDPPRGAEHLSAIFARFVSRRSARVERALKLDPGLRIVEKAIIGFAAALAAAGEERMGYEEASALINGLVTDAQNVPRTLLQVMASEGLVAVDRGWRADFGKRSEMVSFPYQRFSDHLIVEALLSSQLNNATRAQVEAAFGSDGPLEKWLQGAPQGLIEALAVQLPERWGIEILDLFSDASVEADFEAHYRRRHLFEAFLASFTLRRRDAFSERSKELINEGLNEFREGTIEALFAVAPDPEHPFNALRVHEFLSGMSMAERDATWTMAAYGSFGYADAAFDRLVRWAARGPSQCEDEVVALAATAITWAFASPNRYVRDYGTKALASILIDRPEVHSLLIQRFADVDDPYVSQRLVAALCGAITRTWPLAYKRKSACALLEQLLDAFVDSRRVIPDVETRDYIGSLARWLRRRRLITPTLLARATPPYGSDPPKRPRSADHLEKTYPRGQDFSDGYGLLLSSALSSHSDWNRYVISGVVDDFLPTRLGEPIPSPAPPPEIAPQLNSKRWTRFLKSLSAEQMELYEAVEGVEGAKAFAETLSVEQAELYSKSFVVPRRQRRTYRLPMAYPPERAARFIFQRVIELGWTPERFVQFDINTNSQAAYRSSHKRERFGKKYQWIARNELFARLADNFTLKTWSGVETYEGAWQIRGRNLDPTVPPERIEIGDELETMHDPTFPVESPPVWWAPKAPRFESVAPGSEAIWAERSEDLPTPQELHRVRDPENRQWIILEGYHDWRDDPRQAASVSSSAAPYRDIAILSAGTLFRQKDLQKLQGWLCNNADLVRSLPDWGAQDIHQAFWAELPAESERHDFPGRWRRPQSSREIPVRSIPVSLGYLGESGGYDCSLSDTISVQLPSRFLVEEGELEWREEINAWVDAGGREVVRYCQTDEGFHRDRVLMIQEAWLRDFLLEKDLCLAVGLFCERRVFEGLGSGAQRALGWVDFAAHGIFTGKEWISAPLHPVDRHGDSAIKAEEAER